MMQTILYLGNLLNLYNLCKYIPKCHLKAIYFKQQAKISHLIHKGSSASYPHEGKYIGGVEDIRGGTPVDLVFFFVYFAP